MNRNKQFGDAFAEKLAEHRKLLMRDQKQVLQNNMIQRDKGQDEAIRLMQNREYECSILKNVENELIHKHASKICNTEDHCMASLLNDEKCAKLVREAKNEQMVTKYPELRELENKLSTIYNSRLQKWQLMYNQNRKIQQLNEKRAIDRALLQRDREQDLRDQAERAVKDAQRKESYKEFFNDAVKEKAERRAKDREENRQLIEKLIEQENRVIARENEEQQRKRDEIRDAYLSFIDSRPDKKELRQVELANDLKYVSEADADHERNKAFELARRKCVLDRMKQLDDNAQKTATLTDRHEKDKYAFVDALEELELTEARLDALSADRKDFDKKRASAEEIKKVIDSHARLRKARKEEEDRLARQIELGMLADAARKEEERKAQEAAKRAKTKDDIMRSIQEKKVLDEEKARQAREEELAFQRIEDELSEALLVRRKELIAEHDKRMANLEKYCT